MSASDNSGFSGHGGRIGRADDALFDKVLSGIQDPVFVKDGAGRYVYLNRACAKVLGVPGDRRGFTDEDVFAVEEVRLIRAADLSVMASRATRVVEEQVSSAGRLRRFLSTKFPWIDESGEVLGVIGIARDITEQRLAEAAVRESESRFRTMADAAPVFMWTTDSAGACDFVNDSLVQFTGVERARHLGHGWLHSVHAADRRATLDAYRNASRDRVGFDAEQRLRNRTGEWRWVRTAWAPRFDDTGEFVGYVGSGTDVHDARLQQIAVVQSAAELQRLTLELEATVDKLRRRTEEAEAARERAERTERQAVFLDAASRVLQATLDPEATLKSIADLAVPRLADHCVVHLLSDDHFTRIDAKPHGEDPVGAEIATRYPTWAGIGPERVVKTGVSELYTEVTDTMLERAARDSEHLRLLRKQGVTSAMVVPMRAGRRIVGTIMLQASESGRSFGPADLRLAEELARRAAIAVDNAQLYRTSEEASRAKSEFLATMSHELRTPLNAIGGYADLLQLGVSRGEQRNEHLARIKHSADNLVGMIEEMLTFSKLEAGSETVRLEETDARDVLRDAADLLRQLFVQKGLKLRIELPDERIGMFTDRMKMRQILMNLISNAGKFTDEGSVTLRVSRNGEEICFSVADTGRGIREDDLEMIWEPFWQADSGTTRKAGGTGIGLAVAAGLSELLGGELDVESTFGHGSVFTLRVPGKPQVSVESRSA